jgi:hypothetical protein
MIFGAGSSCLWESERPVLALWRPADQNPGCALGVDLGTSARRARAGPNEPVCADLGIRGATTISTTWLTNSSTQFDTI